MPLPFWHREATPQAGENVLAQEVKNTILRMGGTTDRLARTMRPDGTGESSSPRSLRVLPDEISLRDEKGPLQQPMNLRQETGVGGQPRALRALSRIVNDGLCHRCGSCVGICPTNVLEVGQEEYPTITNLSACTDCDLCVRVCPGDEFDFLDAHRKVLGVEGDLTKTHGHFEQALIAYGAAEPGLREKSTSGGLVTAILLHLMDTGQIDGAVVIASDEDVLWKGKPIIARTREELLAATKSKYAIASTNSVFSEIRTVPGKYALVGLPCQIHGFVKAAELDPRLRERVVLTIGLFCHAAIEHEAFEIIWESLGERVNGAKQFVSRVGKHPGAPHLELADGSFYPVYFGNKSGFRPSSMEIINVLYRLYTPARCLTCFDGLAEFADIAVGDPWMAPPDDDVDFHQGWSFGLVRTQRGRQIIRQLQASQKLVWKDLTEKEALSCNKHMVTEKRWRAFRMIETHRRQGKSIPSYGSFSMRPPSHTGRQFLMTEGNMLTHFCCFLPSVRAGLLRFFLGNGGYGLLWLNNKRRRIKIWTRDTLAKFRRKFWGRK